MTNQIQLVPFKCPKLYVYKGGIGEAVLRVEEGNVTGIICDEYAEGVCNETHHQEDLNCYQKGCYQYQHLFNRLLPEVAERKGIRPVKKGLFSGTELPMSKELTEAVEAEIGRLKQEAIKRIKDSAQGCFAAQGFRGVEQ